MKDLENITPKEIAESLSLFWNAEISNIEIAEDFLGWAVRVTVTRNKSKKIWSETGVTRVEAIKLAIEAGRDVWPDVFEMRRR